MIERKIKMQKDKVIKEIPENLVSDYLFMGWSKVKDKKEDLDEPIYGRKSFKKD